jgi:hypothetical protein
VASRAQLERALHDRMARTRALEALLHRELRAGRWRRDRTEMFRRRRDVLRFRRSLARLHKQRAKLKHIRRQIDASRRKEAYWHRRLQRAYPLRLRALHIARTLLGVREQGGNNIGPMVDRIIRANGGIPGEAWCGDFVAYCYRHAGSRAIQRAWAGAWNFGRLFGMKVVAHPEPGDLAVYSWGQGHVAFFERWLGGGRFLDLGGNTGPGGVFENNERHVSQVLRFVRITR